MKSKILIILMAFLFLNAGTATDNIKKNSKKGQDLKMKLQSYATNKFIMENLDLFLNYSMFADEDFEKAGKLLSSKTNSANKRGDKNEKK